MQFKDVLGSTGYKVLKGNLNDELKDIVYDSRKANKDNVFVCLVGVNADGHDYIESAYKQGCRNFVVCKDVQLIDGMNVVEVKNTRQALGYLSANFFGHPEEKLLKIGVTGTKGKTTTSYMIKSIFEKAGTKIGIIGTIGVEYGEVHYETNNTTPESYDIYKYMREMVDAGVTHVVMEVSSLAMKHGRVNGIMFDYAVYTNLSKDHIGPTEHLDFKEYMHCKKMLFENCKKAIINADDEHYLQMITNTCNLSFVGTNAIAEIRPEAIQYVFENGKIGSSFIVHDTERKFNFKVFLDMPGDYNIHNALCAMNVALEEGIAIKCIQEALADFKVSGRLESVYASDDFSVIIDYAHNGVSMESTIKTMRKYLHGRIVCLFGCGGERSKTRRFEMGKIAGELADYCIITEDNSRNEPFEKIANDILEGMRKTSGMYKIIEDRTEAINYCLNNAQKGDIILLLGKGHETYMEKNGKKFHFDERDVIKDWLCNR